MILDILLTLFLVVLNAFFVAAEFAIVKVRAAQIDLRAEAGSALAATAKSMLTHLDAYLSATQLGITLASLGLGWIGEAVVADIVISVLHVFGVELAPDIAHQVALPISFAVITFLHIVFGELMPKSLAIQYSENMTLAVTYPMKVFYWLFRVPIYLLNGFSNYLLRLIGLQTAGEHEHHSAEELLWLINRGKETGAIQSTEHEIIENVFRFSELKVQNIMVPRSQVTAVEKSTPTNTLLNMFAEEGYSRMPVYDDTLDKIVGIVYAKDILTMSSHSNLIVLTDIVRPAFFVDETASVKETMRNFQKRHEHLAVVTDEFGGTAGIITLEDIVEELVGDIQDEYDSEIPIVRPGAKNSFVVDATAAVSDINMSLPVALPTSESYVTMSGLLNIAFEQIPEINAKLELDDYVCTVLAKDQRNITKVRLKLRSGNAQQ